MKEVGEIYRGGFFKKRYSLNWRVNIVCNAVLQSFPTIFGGTNGKKQIKIVDVGCATGDYIAEFDRLGYTALGIEGSEAAKPFLVTDKVKFLDIRKPLPFVESKIFNICMSLEVAEHIEEEYSEQYISNLCFLSDIVILTAAGPGQGGHHHVNLKQKEYWIEKFQRRMYKRLDTNEVKFLSMLAPYKQKVGINSYYNNLMIFGRK